MNKILVEVSVGELLDKISILELKMLKIEDKDKLVNIKKEFDALDPSLKKLVQTKFKDYNNYYKNCTDKISHKEFLKSIYD